MIKLNIFGREVEVNPIEFSCDGIVVNGAFNDHGFSSCTYAAGSFIDLSLILHDEWINRRSAALAYTSPIYRVCDVTYYEFTDPPTEVSGWVGMQYTYDPQNPNVLGITVYNNGLKGPAQYSFRMFMDEPQGSANCICCCQIKYNNYPQPVDGAMSLIFCVPVEWYESGGRVYGGGYVRPYFPGSGAWDPSQIVWEHLSLTYNNLSTKSYVDPSMWTGYNLRYNYINNGLAALTPGEYNIKINDEEYIPSSSEPTDTPETPDSPYKQDTSDPFPYDGLPSNSILDTGFIKAYYITDANCRDLAAFMMSDAFIDNVKKLYANPIDYVVGLHKIPVIPSYGGAVNIGIGGVGTGVSGNPITNAYVDFDCGTLTDIKEVYSSFMDYEPHTKCQLYLPFVGFMDVNTNDLMSGTLNVSYKINVITGEAVCVLTVKNNKFLDGVCYTYPCVMSEQVPITMADYNNRYQSALNACAALATVGIGIYSENPMAVAAGMTSLLSNSIDTATAHPIIKRSGSISGGSGILSPFTPALIIERPVEASPKAFKDLLGKVSNISDKIGKFKGFNKFNNIKLNSRATDAEKDAITDLLESGVFI